MSPRTGGTSVRLRSDQAPQASSQSGGGWTRHGRGRAGWITAALTAAVALFASVPAHAQIWEYRKALTIDDAKVASIPGGTCEANLSSFPVLVSLTDASLRTTANGGRIRNSTGSAPYFPYDLIFRASDGTTQLDHEIETWSPTTGALVAWVRVPTLPSTGNGDTTIYIYYGNAAVSSDQSNPTGVWDNNFRGVWHLKESPAGTAPQMKDSKNANHGTTYGAMLPGDQVAAQANGGLDYDGSAAYPNPADDYVETANSGSTLNAGQAFTVEAWIKRDVTGFNHGLLTKAWDTSYSFKLSMQSNDAIRLDVESNGGTYDNVSAADTTITDTNFHHVGGYATSGQSLRVFTDGAIDSGTGTRTGTTDWDTGGALIGAARWASTAFESFSGVMDEVRISNVVRTACWIGTTYSSINAPGSFYSVGTEENIGLVLDQEGFRFRNDDGSESTATWLAAQDTNITRDKNLNTRLRALVNATGDAPSQQYQLEYKLSTDSVYTRVLTAQPSTVLPTYVAAGGIASGTGTIAPTLPAGIQTDDILLLFVESANQAISISNQNGGTWTETIDSPQGVGAAPPTDPSTRLAVFWSRYNGTQGDPTVADSGNHTIGRIVAVRGCITSGDPFDVTAGATEGTLDTSGSIPGHVTTVDNSLVVVAITSSFLAGANGNTEFSGWSNAGLANLTERTDNIRIPNNGGAIGVATGQKASAGSYGTTSVTLANAAYKAMWTGALKPVPVTQEAILLSDSANIAASGANTAARLTAPSGKTTANFTAGRIQDDENPADAVDILNNYYTELEWSLKATDAAQYGGIYQFRVTVNGTPLSTYSVTPQWTVNESNPPTPNPMTFAVVPVNDSPTQISMTATTASDVSPPINYLFTNDNSACGANAGTGGTSSAWQGSTAYADAGLQANKCYGYTVTARDSLSNTGTPSSIASTYTSANTPGTPTLTAGTQTTLQLTNAQNSNPASNPTTSFAVQVVTTSPSDGTWLSKWVDGSGNPSGSEVWLTDAQLDALVLQGLSSGTTYGVKVKARNQDGDETPLSAEGQGTTTVPPNLAQIHYRWRNDDGGEVAAGGTITEKGSNTSIGNSGSASITHGLAIAANDVIVAMVHANGSVTISDNNGAFPFVQQIQEAGQATNTYAIYYRVAGASEPTSYSWNLSATQQWSLQIRVFSGVDTAAVWDVAPSASTRATGTTATANAPTMTISTAGATGIIAFFTDSGTATYGSPTNGYAAEVEPAASRAQASYIRTWATTGPTGASSATITGTTGWLAHQFALKPAPPASAATFAVAQDTELTSLVKNTPKRVRFEVSNEGGTSSGGVTYQLQVAQTSTCSSGTYSPVPTGTGGHWQIVGSAYITDGQATSNINPGLTDEATTFVPGQLKDTGNTTGSITLAPDEFTEIEFAIQATANAIGGATYCFRLYDATVAQALGTYSVYAQATLDTESLTLANHPSGPAPDAFGTTTPTTATLFQFRLAQTGGVTVDTLRARFTTAGGVVNGDVSGGELWADTNGNGTWDGSGGGDTLVQGGVAPSSGVLTFTSDFTPASGGTNYFVRATVSNLFGGDTTTVSLALADIDPLPAAVPESGSASNAVHTQDGPLALYRSVGVTASNLNTVGRTVEISGSTATFSGSVPDNVGVGDVLQYQVGVTWYVAFIYGRSSSTVYTVKSSTGAAPQAASAGTAVGLYRAYTSLFNWQALNENDSLDDSVENFDTSAHLVAADRVMNVACYGDGADTASVTIAGWTTDPDNYIRIYTPVSAGEVGASQRHPGTWSTSAYRIEATPSSGNGVVWVRTDYVRVDGLQVDMGGTAGNTTGIYLNKASDTGAAAYEVSNSIVRGNPAATADTRIGINLFSAGTGTLKVWNNVVYDFKNGSSQVAGILLDDAGFTSYLYNNTIVDNNAGLDIAVGTVVAKNNLVYNNANNYYGTFNVSSTNNLSGPASDPDIPPSNARNGVTVAFRNSALDDFHLSGADAGAVGYGANLTADASLAFTADIDGATRPASGAWDIGADEVDGLFQGHYRWRYDDGSQTSATWAAPQDTALAAVPRMVPRRLRFGVSNEGVASASARYQLQLARSDTCESATYAAVPLASGEWEIVASSNVGDGEVTTDLAGLTNDATTFVAGQVKDAGNTTATITLGVNQFTEVEFVVRATASALTQANYCFRLYDALNDRALGTYAAYAQASVASGGQMLVRTGSYVGNGGTRVVTGLGFQPDVVLIASEEMGFAGAERYAVIRTSTMSGNLSKSIIYNDADPLADRIVSLDSNGFTVGHPGTEDAAARITCVNHSSSVTYHWTAFRAASGEMTVGTYTGNGSSPRDITGVGFTPDYVIAMPLGVGWSYQHSSEMPVNDSYYFEGTAPLTVGILDLLTDGFRVGTGANWNNEPFHYIAWKEVAGRMSVGKYSGTGVEPLNITDVGFQPANVFVNSGHLKPDTTGASTDKTLAFRCYDNCASTDHIEALLSNGFRLGGDYDTNPDPVLDPPPDNIRHYAAFAAPRLEQVHYRWRNDDGDEAGASWAAGQDTALAGLAPTVPLRLRFEVANENSQSSGAVTYQLQVAQTATCSTGTYTAVPTDSSGHWQVVPSANLTDGAATTNVSPGLTDEATTFVAGQVKETGATTGSITLGADAFTEIEFSLQATANASGAYCFRLYDTTGARPLDAYGAYPQASLASLTLADLPSGQVGDQLGTTTPVTGTFFQFRLTPVGAVTVDTLRVRFTTGSGIANDDISGGELWQDTNGNGAWDGAGSDTLIEGSVTPSAGVLTFTTNFVPAISGTSYFVRAAAANLAAGDTTTFSVTAADIDETQAGLAEAGSISSATHVQDYTSGGDVYYSVGTSSPSDLKTGGPTITIVNGTATLSAAQTGNVGVGDRIEFTGGPAYIKAVVSPNIFVVSTATGTIPADVLAPVAVTTIRREFVSIATAESGSPALLGCGSPCDLVTGNRKLTWVAYNDGPLNVNANTTISGYTTGAANYITLTVAGASQVASGISQRHTGVAGTGTVIEVTATVNENVLTVAAPYTRVEWLELDGNDFTVWAGIQVDSAANNSLLRHLLIHDVETTGSQGDGFGLAIDGSNTTVRNCIVYEFGEDGIYVTATGTLVQNTTLHKTTNTSNPGEALQVSSGNSAIAENVIATDAEFYSEGTLTCYNSISSNSSATTPPGCDGTGTGNQTNRSAASLFVSAVSGYYDLHLRAGSDARDTGLDLSTTRLFSDDVDGQSRPYGSAWDVGADEAWPSPALQLQILSGTYNGDTAQDDRAITVGFQPDLVIVDSETTSTNAVIRTSTMTTDPSKVMDQSAGMVANQIQSLTATGFTVGTLASVNQTGGKYHWIAMKAGAGVMKVGSYTGNGTTQTITGLGFTPVYVVVIPENNQYVIQRSTTMRPGYSMSFAAESWNTGITAFRADGFDVGTLINTSSIVYHYAAWAAVPGSVSVGTYVGNNTDNRQITGTGFMPEWVALTEAYANGSTGGLNAPAHKSASTGTTTDRSLLFNTNAFVTLNIKALQSDGFLVGNDGRVNAGSAPNTYHWAAFGPHAPRTYYRSIGNTSLVYGAGASGVNVVSGSNVVDAPDAQWVTDKRGRGDVITIASVNYMVGSVVSETRLLLSEAYQGTTQNGVSGTQIRRQFSTLADWEACIDGDGGALPPAAPCYYFRAPNPSLVTDDRSEVGIVYNDGSAYAGGLDIEGSVTDATHTITLTVDPGHRHTGVGWNGTGSPAGVAVNNGSGISPAIQILDDHVTVEWLDVRGGSGASAILVQVNNLTPVLNSIVLRQNLLHDGPSSGIQVLSPNAVATISGNIIYNVVRGINLAPGSAWASSSVIRVLANTVVGGATSVNNFATNRSSPRVLLVGNLSYDARTGADYAFNGAPDLDSQSSHNFAEDNTGTTHSPAGGGSNGVAPTFVSAAGGNFHLTSGSDGIDDGPDLSALILAIDIDNEHRPTSGGAGFAAGLGSLGGSQRGFGSGGGWDVGADEYNAFTAVKLAAFTARGFESAVLVEWETASELDNLGFHLYRGASADGPWTRLNASLIPGLGSSPEGKQYRHVDAGLVNDATYFYRLEDVDRRGRVTSHGPVAATPTAGVPEPGEGGGEGGGGEGGGGGPAEPPPSPKTNPKASWKPHGEPETQSLRVLERSSSGVTLELATGGFYSEEQPDGTTKLIVPGFFDHSAPGRPTVPTRRLWQDALVGRGVKLVSTEPSDLVAFSGLNVPLAGKPVAVATPEGTYEASALPVSPAEALKARAKDAASAGGGFPASFARVHQIAFQGERKKAYVELSPLRVNETTGRVVLARRLLVRLAFTGAVDGEQGKGSVGRRAPVPVASDAAAEADPQVLARFATISRGLHAVTFEEVPGFTGALTISSLRLSRLGASVPFHVEPRSGSFGPGSTLYFLSEGTDSAYANEAVYELSLGSGGVPMPVAVASARRVTTTTPLATLRHEGSFETDLNYLPALTEARDLWVWDYGLAGAQGQDYAFAAHAPALVPETARLRVDVEGGSDTLVSPDHHVLAFVNGSFVGDLRFDGMVPATLEADVPTSLLHDGANTLRLENAGDTGSTASFVYLDRFSLEYPRPLTPTAGVLEGKASQPGRASLEAAPGSILLDTTGATPVFLGRALGGGRLAWSAELNHRYLAVFPEALQKPEVRPASASTLRAVTNQADWIVLAPEALLPAAETLAAHREAQGLVAMAVSLEDVVDEFGFGEAGPHAVRDFLAFAFHRWQSPSPRYVLLLGDASYDPKGRLTGTSRPDRIPTTFTKSTFLWTPADPLYAAVNGTDSLPDIAIGRINAASLAEADVAVQKILDFENAGLNLTGKATLVADNPDQAGDFEANQDEIATLLPSRNVQKLFLAQLGAAATKAAVRNAFDAGASLVSYVGHGSSGLWASEGILRSPDVASFAPQPRQPLVLTMTCSNGYFVSPYNNSLSERLVLAADKGAIASFSPSGLSLDAAAHVYHRAVVSELELGGHDRLGDLLLAAQAQYAASGAFPELLDFYNLLGDPALEIR